MKGFILAAGFGTRLWPLTEDRTKAAIPFLNRPLINYSVEYLASHGITDIIVNLHHQPESIRAALGDGSNLGVTIEYSHEDEILGTSGALDRVRASLLDDDFVVINGKIVTNIDLGQVIAEHRKQNAIATLVLKRNTVLEHFSIVEIDDRDWITRFAGFPDAALPQAAVADATGYPGGVVARTESAPLMFTGIQVLSPRIFEYIPHGCFSHSTIHVYPQAIAAGEAVVGHVSAADWYEVSTLNRYLEAHLRLMRGGSLITGQDCVIERGASVEQAVLWDRVTVESGASVRQSVLADGVRIPANAVIERAVIVRRDIVRQIERGKVVGENVIVPV
jgi:mannose-1-phosphate guanylyltransferase/phosphomannomutase